MLAAGSAALGQGAIPSYDLALVGLDGRREVVGRLPGVFAPRVSPDGRRAVFELGTPEGASLWVADLTDLDARRELPAVRGPRNWAAVWHPDGERLVFLVTSDAPDALHVRSADGTGEAEHLIDARSPESWTPGGAQLTVLTLVGDGDYGISMLDLRSGASTVLADRPGSAQHSSHVSPDGRWIAYSSDETGRFEVWVEPLPPTGERHRITRDGGGHPLWAPDGAALFFDRDQRLYRVALSTAGALAIGAPTELPIAGFEQGLYRRQFDLLPDGRRFLMLFAAAGGG